MSKSNITSKFQSSSLSPKAINDVIKSKEKMNDKKYENNLRHQEQKDQLKLLNDFEHRSNSNGNEYIQGYVEYKKALSNYNEIDINDFIYQTEFKKCERQLEKVTKDLVKLLEGKEYVSTIDENNVEKIFKVNDSIIEEKSYIRIKQSFPKYPKKFQSKDIKFEEDPDTKIADVHFLEYKKNRYKMLKSGNVRYLEHKRRRDKEESIKQQQQQYQHSDKININDVSPKGIIPIKLEPNISQSPKITNGFKNMNKENMDHTLFSLLNDEDDNQEDEKEVEIPDKKEVEIVDEIDDTYNKYIKSSPATISVQNSNEGTNNPLIELNNQINKQDKISLSNTEKPVILSRMTETIKERDDKNNSNKRDQIRDHKLNEIDSPSKSKALKVDNKTIAQAIPEVEEDKENYGPKISSSRQIKENDPKEIIAGNKPKDKRISPNKKDSPAKITKNPTSLALYNVKQESHTSLKNSIIEKPLNSTKSSKIDHKLEFSKKINNGINGSSTKQKFPLNAQIQEQTNPNLNLTIGKINNGNGFQTQKKLKETTRNPDLNLSADITNHTYNPSNIFAKPPPETKITEMNKILLDNRPKSHSIEPFISDNQSPSNKPNEPINSSKSRISIANNKQIQKPLDSLNSKKSTSINNAKNENSDIFGQEKFASMSVNESDYQHKEDISAKPKGISIHNPHKKSEKEKLKSILTNSYNPNLPHETQSVQVTLNCESDTELSKIQPLPALKIRSNTPTQRIRKVMDKSRDMYSFDFQTIDNNNIHNKSLNQGTGRAGAGGSPIDPKKLIDEGLNYPPILKKSIMYLERKDQLFDEKQKANNLVLACKELNEELYSNRTSLKVEEFKYEFKRNMIKSVHHALAELSEADPKMLQINYLYRKQDLLQQAEDREKAINEYMNKLFSKRVVNTIMKKNLVNNIKDFRPALKMHTSNVREFREQYLPANY